MVKVAGRLDQILNELGEVDGQYYIAMEYVNGIDAHILWRTLARRRRG